MLETVLFIGLIVLIISFSNMCFYRLLKSGADRPADLIANALTNGIGISCIILWIRFVVLEGLL